MYYKHAKYYDSIDDSRKLVRDSLMRFIPDDHKEVLDVGCGTGSSSLLLKDKGYTVTGIDLSAEMVAIAKEKDPSITFINDDVLFHLFHNRFDLILCSTNILNHMQNLAVLRAFITKMHSLLSKDSIFIFDLPKLQTLKNNPSHTSFNGINILNHYDPKTQVFTQITNINDTHELNKVKYWEPLQVYMLLREHSWTSIELENTDTSDIFILKI